MYIIPEKVRRVFHQISSKNLSPLDKGHVETLAFLIGKVQNENYLGTHLIFPKQNGEAFRVTDEGKCFLDSG